MINPKRMISKLYSVTPVILKNDFGYWKAEMSLPEYEERLIVNLMKKYQSFTGEKIEDDVHLYDSILFKNKMAQKLAYFALGVGLGENNSRSCGFVNYKYL